MYFPYRELVYAEGDGLEFPEAGGAGGRVLTVCCAVCAGYCFLFRHTSLFFFIPWCFLAAVLGQIWPSHTYLVLLPAIPCFFFLVFGRIRSSCTYRACGGRFGLVVLWWVSVASQFSLTFLVRPSSGFSFHTTCGLLFFCFRASLVSLLSRRKKWVNEWDPLFAAGYTLRTPLPLFFPFVRFAWTYLLFSYACGPCLWPLLFSWLFRFCRLHPYPRLLFGIEVSSYGHVAGAGTACVCMHNA